MEAESAPNETPIDGAILQEDNGHPVPTVTPRTERKMCGAKCRSGRPCTQRPMTNGRCKMHGGMCPGGPASGTFKHGRYSKYVPKDMRKIYDKASADDQLLSLREDVALLESRQIALLTRLSETPPPPWNSILSALQRLKDAEDAEEVGAAMEALETIVMEGRSAARLHREVWSEVRELVQEKTKTATAEWKRLHELKAVLTVEQAMTLVHTMIQAAREVVSDKGQLKQLLERTVILLPPEKT